MIFKTLVFLVNSLMEFIQDGVCVCIVLFLLGLLESGTPLSTVLTVSQ